MFLYCSVSVSFVAIISLFLGMAHRPLGHGSAPPAAPFGLIPSFDSSLVAAHGADLLAHPRGKANADTNEVGVERVNSRSSQGCLAQRVTTTTLDRECVPGGGSSEPLDRKPMCTSVNSVCDTSVTRPKLPYTQEARWTMVHLHSVRSTIDRSKTEI